MNIAPSSHGVLEAKKGRGKTDLLFLKSTKNIFSKKVLTIPLYCDILMSVAEQTCWCSSVGRAADL